MTFVEAPAKILITGNALTVRTNNHIHLLFSFFFTGANGYFATYAVKDLLERGYSGMWLCRDIAACLFIYFV